MALTQVDLQDNEKLIFGTGNDLEIFHDSSNSYISDTGTGNLLIRAQHLQIQGANGENMVYGNQDGSVELYYDAVKKLESTNTGIKIHGSDGGGSEVFGDMYWDNASNAGKDMHWDQSANKLSLADDVILALGGDSSAGDLQLYHDASNSHIKDSGTGHLQIDGSRIQLRNVANDDPMVDCTGGGVVELFYDGTKRYETTSSGGNVRGVSNNTSIDYAASQILKITNTSDTNNVHSALSFPFGSQDRGPAIYAAYRGTVGEGDLIFAPDYAETAAVFKPHGTVELYYDNSLRLFTKSDGIDVRGPEGGEANIYLNADESDDNPDKWRFRASIYGSGHWQFYDGSSWDDAIKCVSTEGVELAYDGTTKLQTTSAGGTLHGNWAGKVGLQNAQQWRVNSNFTMSTSGAVIDSNWEAVDTDGGGSFGTQMSESSGVFTFPSTGHWLIHFFYTTTNTAGDSKYNEVQIQTTINNSSYGEAAAVYSCNDTTGFISNGAGHFLFDVDDTSNCKVRFSGYAWSGNTTFYGHTTTCQNAATFIRLGDT